mgnify:FL=1
MAAGAAISTVRRVRSTLESAGEKVGLRRLGARGGGFARRHRGEVLLQLGDELAVPASLERFDQQVAAGFQVRAREFERARLASSD